MDHIELPTERSLAKKADTHLQGYLLRKTVWSGREIGWDKQPIAVVKFVVATEGLPRWDDWHVVVVREREAGRVMCFMQVYPPGQNPEVAVHGHWVSRRIERNLERGGPEENFRADSYILATSVRFLECPAALRKRAAELMQKEKGYRT
jgi:hypothetical protein